MRRRLTGVATLVATLLLVSMVPVSASHESGHDRPGCGRRNLEACESTTTTAAEITTTTEATTTTESTTTTTAPTTTTTVPETIPLGLAGKGEGYNIELFDFNTDQNWWKTAYFFDLPYAEGYGWAAGDRGGYTCGYGHQFHGGTLVVDDRERYDLTGGVLKARWTALRLNADPDQPAYAGINDEYMLEGQRHYDGTFGPAENTQAGFGECRDLPRVDYGLNFDPPQTPVVVFRDGGQVTEIRDYRLVERLYSGLKFRLIDPGPDHDVGVVADVDNRSAVVFYYDAFNGATVEAFLP